MTSNSIYDLIQRGNDYVIWGESKPGDTTLWTVGKILESNNAGLRVDVIKLEVIGGVGWLERFLSPYNALSGPHEMVFSYNSNMEVSNNSDPYWIGKAVVFDGYRECEGDNNQLVRKVRKVRKELREIVQKDPTIVRVDALSPAVRLLHTRVTVADQIWDRLE